MKQEGGKSTLERVSALQWLVGVPEEAERFHVEAMKLLGEMNEKNKPTHLPYLLGIIRRQEAFLEKVQRYACEA